MILPTTVSGSPGTLAAMDKNQLPAIVRGALKAYTPGFGLASGTNAESISEQPHGDGGHVARFDLGFDGLEHVVVCPSQYDIGQGHEDRYRSASENKSPRHCLKQKLTNSPTFR
jgi:hypothetical protein